MFDIFLATEYTHQSWYLNSGCSGYMMKERHIFQSLTLKQEDIMGFRGNQREKIIGLRNIGNSSFPSINNVLIVD